MFKIFPVIIAILLLSTSCIRDVLDVFGIAPRVPEADSKTFWYTIYFEKDTLSHPLQSDATITFSNTEYNKPVESHPYRIVTLYEFGFDHLLDTNEHKHAIFNFFVNTDNHFLDGQLISDTTFFEVNKKYNYGIYELYPFLNDTTNHRRLESYFDYQDAQQSRSFWYSFSKHDSDNDTAYTLNFEFDSPIWNNTNNQFDTLHIRNGKLNISRKYENYVYHNRKKLEYNYQTSDGFIK